MSMPRKITIILVALFLLAGLVGVTILPSEAAVSSEIEKCKYWHMIQPDEYLIKIAKLYDVDWRYLAELNDLRDADLIYPNKDLCISLTRTYSLPPQPTVLPGLGTGAKVYAASVIEDESVTLVGTGLSRYTWYAVYLSSDRANNPTEYLMSWLTTDKNGVFRVTYDLPNKLHDAPRLRATVKNGLIVIASDWFINGTTELYTGGNITPAIKISLMEVKKNDLVSIKFENLPSNVVFTVSLGEEGTQGVPGDEVGTLLRDENDPNVIMTFNIPAMLYDQTKLDLRLENQQVELVKTLTFENKDYKVKDNFVFLPSINR